MELYVGGGASPNDELGTRYILSQCKIWRFVYLIACLLVYLTLPASQARLHEDRDALRAWAHRLENGTFLREWRFDESAASPCDWQGVVCGDWNEELRVLGLDLPGSLAAAQPMPLGLGKLSGLQTLVLGAVTFSGTVPVDIGNCSNLEVLDISSNQFQDNLPGEIFAACHRLRILNASRCNFVGELPDELWSCRHLEVLDVAYNEFTGSLVLGKDQTSRLLPNLTTLDFSANGFTGPISTLLTTLDCSKLTNLDLSFNNFTSSVVPPQLRNCSELRNVVLRFNNITGVIPEDLGEMQHLEYLQLSKNALTGTLPKSFLQCRHLWALDVSENHLSGAIPGWLSAIPSLRYFSAYSNNFLGSIPSEIGRARELIHFDFSDNALTGAIPPELGNVTTLRFLRLNGNRLVDALPESLGNLRNLRGLDLSGNRLTGPVPATLGNLHKLRWLQMEENRLNGWLPPELGNCRSLQWLNLRSNRLSGEIPATFYSLGANVTASHFSQSEVDEYYPAIRFGYCSLVKIWIPDKNGGTEIQGLVDDDCRPVWTNQLLGIRVLPLLSWQLSNNRLSGNIPVPEQPIPYLLILMLSQNLITGSIPANISMVPLYILDVARNRISGEVPDMFTALAMTLEGLDVSENRLQGPLPASLNYLSSLQSYNFSFNPELEGAVPHEGPFRNFDANAYLGNYQLCKDRDLHEAPASQAMRYCDEVKSTEEDGMIEKETKFRVVDVISMSGFGLGTGVGFFVVGVVYKTYWFGETRRRAPSLLGLNGNRVGAWQPPT